MKRLISLILVLTVLTAVWAFSAQAAGEYRGWLQSDPRWGSISFSASDTMSKSGCAITSIAKLMVHSGAVPDDETLFNPGVYVNWLKANGAITSQGWIIWANAAGYSDKFSYVGEASLLGAAKTEIVNTIQSYIEKGNVIVVCVKNGGHYVAVDRVADGTVYIMDSALNGPKELFGYSGIEKIRIYKGPHNGSGANAGGTPSYDTTVDPVGVGKYVITSDNGVNLRSGVGTSHSVLTAVPYNTTVQITKVQSGWGYTTYNGKSGWLTLEFAKLTENSLRGLQITPPKKTTYLRGEELDITGLTVTALYADGSQKAITQGYTVSKFSSETAGECKVYVSYLTKAAEFTVTIQPKVYTTGAYVVDSADGVNLRSGAGTSFDKVGGIPNNTRVTVTQVQENWGKTLYNGVEGWLCLDYAKLSTAAQSGLSIAVKRPCLLIGDVPMAEDFTVYRTFDDGSRTLLEEFDLQQQPTEKGLAVTVVDGNFSMTVELLVFEAVPAGDCDFDGSVTANDALLTLKKVVGKPMNVFYDDAADVDQDGSVTAVDALWVLQHVVGKRPTFEVAVTPTDY